MSRILLVLLVCFCSSLRANYTWNGSEWVWVEPARQPTQPQQQQGSGGGANFDDDYDDEDASPYDKDDLGGDDDDDDDDDDDYYNNYDQKSKKGGIKGKVGKGDRTPVTAGPKGGKGNGGGGGQSFGPVLTGGKGSSQDKKPGKQQDKEPKGKKIVDSGKGKPAVTSGSKRVEPALPPQRSPASRGKGGAAFIPTDDEDLVEGSGGDESDNYWDSGSGGGAPYIARDPIITDSSPDIDLDMEDNNNKKAATSGGGGKPWSVDTTWAGTTQDTRPRTVAPTPPAKTSGPAPVGDDDYGDDDDDEEDDDDDYADKNPVEDYDDDELTISSDDDISIDEAGGAGSSTTSGPPAGGRLPATPAAPVSSTIRTTAAPSATTVQTTTNTGIAGGGGSMPGANSNSKGSIDDTPIISDMLPNNRPVSFFAQPGILAAVIGGAVVGLLCAILLVMFIVYRMRKKDEGSYILDEPAKRTLGGNLYTKTPNKEFYA